MQTIKAILDNREITARPGQTILQAARDNGLHIPALCDHPAITPFGACRVCLVEVEKNPKLLPACTTPLVEGMVIHSRSPKVQEARRAVVELILVRHPLDCFSCPSNGKCELQDIAYELGISESRFREETDVQKGKHRLEDANPFYVRDMDKCILCGRCVRACDELARYHAIDFQQRGVKTMVHPPIGKDLEHSDCVFCGQCVQLCPVGALYEKASVGQGRPWELKHVKTTCAYCGVGCELTISVNERTGRVANVTTDYSSKTALNEGRCCVKGRFAWQFVHSDDRLTKPLIRENGSFREASWDEALGLVAYKFAQIKEHHGPDALSFLSSARCTNEENYLLQRFAREVIGTNNVDHCARLCHASSVAGLAETLGSGAMTNSYASIKEADVMLVIGSNTTEAHPVIGSWIKENKQKGKKLIVCDPRKIELAKYADVYLRQRGGSDVALLNGLMHVIIKEDLYDKAFVEERTENFEALKALVATYDPQRVSEITGVAPEDIVNAARLYAKGPNSAIFYTMGITQHTTGTDNVRSISNLALLCGMFGRPGTGVNPLRGQNNVQGACDMGCLPNVLPGYAKVVDATVRERAKKLWNADVPATPGRTVVRMLNGAIDGEIKGLFIMGENPMVSDPDTNHVRHALETLDFLVVQDIFLTETAQLADVVLPAACWAEKDGTFTNTMRAVQRVRKAVNPPGEAKADWEILVSLARKSGVEWHFASPSEIFDDLARFVPSYAGMSYARLEKGPLSWPCPDAEHPGTPILHTAKFARPNGKGLFSPCEWKAPHEWPDEEYPFLASTGRLLYHYHTGSMTRRSAPGTFVKELYIEINPADAERLAVRDGEMLCVASRRGEVRGKAKITETVPPKMVFLPFHFGEAPANALTAGELDPTAEIPGLKVSAVRVQKG